MYIYIDALGRTSAGYWLKSLMHAPRSMAPARIDSSIGSGAPRPAPEYCPRAAAVTPGECTHVQCMTRQ